MQTLQGKNPKLKVYTNWTPELGKVDMIPDSDGWYDLESIEEDEYLSLSSFWGTCRIIDADSVVATEPHERLQRHDYCFTMIHKSERSRHD